MDPRTVLLVFSGWAVVSALGVAVLGAVTLAGGRRRRPRGAFPFGLFALSWGAHIVLGNVANVVLDPGTARLLHLLSIAAILPAPYLLVELAAALDPSPDDASHWTTLRGLAVVVAFAAVGSLVLVPELFFRGVSDAGYFLAPDWGILRSVLALVPFFAAMGLSLWSFHRAKRASPTPRTTRQASILLAGLGLFLGYNSANNLLFYVIGLSGGISVRAVVFAVLFGALTALVAWIAVAELRSARLAPTPGEARRDRLVAAALLVPAGWGLVEAWIATAYIRTFYTVGLWRLAGVGVIAYGLARWRIFDLPDRARRGAATGSGVTAAGVGGLLVYAGAGAVLAGAAPAALGVLAAGASLLPSVRASRSLLEPDPGADGDQRVYQQRIDSYRAAVEAAMARDMPEEDRAFLEGLREEYDITPEEDRVIRYYARDAVVGVDDGADGSTYERLRLLGEGGEGRTWLARDRARERLVVLKEPLAGPLEDPQIREETLQEARAARKVQHPNVVAVDEVVETEDSPVLVMEHVEGGSLADLLEAEGPLPWSRARPVLLDVLAGLAAVHRAGLVHRDVKPSNVLLDADGTAKVGDFGVATRRPDAPGGETLRDPEATVGTRGYVAPEVESGDRADELADVYGAGALLHACLHGRPPDPEGGIEAPAGAPDGVAEVLARALAPDPGDRYTDVEAMREAAEAMRGD